MTSQGRGVREPVRESERRERGGGRGGYAPTVMGSFSDGISGRDGGARRVNSWRHDYRECCLEVRGKS